MWWPRAWASTSGSAPSSCIRGPATAARASPRTRARWRRLGVQQPGAAAHRGSRDRGQPHAAAAPGGEDHRRHGLGGRTADRRAGPGVQAEHRRRTRGARRCTCAASWPAPAPRFAHSTRWPTPPPPKRSRTCSDRITFAATAYDAIAGAEALVIMTEWNEFRGLDLERVRRAMARPLLVDARNVLDPVQTRQIGLRVSVHGPAVARPRSECRV